MSSPVNADTMETISVLDLNRRLSNAIAMAPDVRNVWVQGETSDVRSSSGHCYFELVQKGDDGSNVSRIRAIIWAGNYANLGRKFASETGMNFTSGLKVRVCVSASYHPTYGMSVTVSDIDSSYTAGDAVRRRNEILQRLTREGIIERNRRLEWATVPNRIAVISAPGAAGYGDFITHLFSSATRLRFDVELFHAVMQGDRTAQTVREALQAIAARVDRFDTVVIIRGGGATSDLAAFDNYDLAAEIANFPLPVIIGIGHERDITVLDYVANKRVKTPTAAAECLIERVNRVLEGLSRAAEKIYLAASERIGANRELLAHASASLPGTVMQSLMTQRNRLERGSLGLVTSVSSAVNIRKERLGRYTADIVSAATRAVERNRDGLNSRSDLLAVLSPDAILARGFSMTLLPDGSVLKDAAQAPPSTVLDTRLARGTVRSTVTETTE